MALHEQRVAVPGGHVAVVDYGGSGPDVLLVHSVGHSCAVWDAVAHELAPDARAVAIDLRGHGRSEAPATEFTQVGEDLAAVIDALGLSRPVLVGHDVSGGFVTAAAADHPGRVGGVVLVDSPTLEPQATVRGLADMVGTDEVIAFLAQRFGLGATGPDETSKEEFVASHAGDNAADMLAAAPDEPSTRRLMERNIAVAPDGSWVFRPLPETMLALTRGPDEPTVHPGREVLTQLPVPVTAIVLTQGRYAPTASAVTGDEDGTPVRVITLDSDPYVLYADPRAVADAILDTARAR